MQPHMRRSVAGTLVNYFTPFTGHVERGACDYTDADFTAQAYADRFLNAADSLTAIGFHGPTIALFVAIPGTETGTGNVRGYQTRRLNSGAVLDEGSPHVALYEWYRPNVAGEMENVLNHFCKQHGTDAAVECWRLAFAGKREELIRPLRKSRPTRPPTSCGSMTAWK